MGVAWAALIRPEPRGSLRSSLVDNYGVYLLLYPTSFALLHGLLPKVLRPLKYEPAPPERDIVVKEVRRSAVSVAVCTAIEAFVESVAVWPRAEQPEEVTWRRVAMWFGLLYAWGDWHFYWQHRLMHTKRLYRFHKVHHESRNPNTFSSISFHPVESAAYFSAMLLPCAVPIPYWAFCMLKIGLLVFPLFGHLGHGPEVADWHYVHHQVTHYNFGATKLWDIVFGTNYVK